MKVQEIKIKELVLPEWNPRKIKEAAFQKLCDSIKTDPDFLNVRPVIVSNRTGQNVVIAGSMRTRACQHLGRETVPCVILTLSEEQEQRWSLKDNVHMGEWDYGLLANFDDHVIADSGLDVSAILGKEEHGGFTGNGENKETGCARCKELRKEVEGHERRSGHTAMGEHENLAK